MKLRDLFDKLTPGMLDTDVTVKRMTPTPMPGFPMAGGSQDYDLKGVEVQDDGSITLVISE